MTLILLGKADNLIPIGQAERFAAALEKAGVPVHLVTVDDGHLFKKPASQKRWVEETVRFLNERFE